MDTIPFQSVSPSSAQVLETARELWDCLEFVVHTYIHNPTVSFKCQKQCFNPIAAGHMETSYPQTD